MQGEEEEEEEEEEDGHKKKKQKKTIKSKNNHNSIPADSARRELSSIFGSGLAVPGEPISFNSWEGGKTKEISMKNIGVKVLITNQIIWNSKQKQPTRVENNKTNKYQLLDSLDIIFESLDKSLVNID